ncbi:NADH dehydrogenase (ubiquinone) B14.5 B subunit [Lycorma delicatula]|uniref:NADH dehydrogenase (ubiquinone) B14.5 B subunit n=1 Tax=Lycorma delicatula TaxID=130591 RepID=UPI003F515CDC
MAAPNDPRTLLIPDEYHQKTFLRDKYGPIILGSVAFGIVSGLNVNYGKPFYSGIHRHAIWTILAAVAGKFLTDRREAYFAERDAIFRNYIELHPEDFPTPERRYLKDVFEPWHPVR